MSRATRDEQQIPAPGVPPEEGAVIVEFAAVFVVFAMLLAGLITYGMVFAIQQSLEHGTSEAARSVVGVMDEGTLEERVEDTLNSQLAWLVPTEPALEDPDLEHWICFAGDPDPCPAELDENSVHVRVRYSGGLLSLMPFRIATPDQAVATATLDHDLEEAEEEEDDDEGEVE